VKSEKKFFIGKGMQILQMFIIERTQLFAEIPELNIVHAMNQQTSIDHTLIRRLTDIIIANLETEYFGPKELAREIGIGSFNLNRKLSSICGKTINQFIREVRLQSAMERLSQTTETASEVGFKVGFNSPAYFSTCFSEYYGYPPGEVKRKGLSGNRGDEKKISEVLITDTEQPVQKGEISHKLKMAKGRAVAFASFTIVFIIISICFSIVKDPAI
jgi:AraC-like DNA-binding protein